MICVFCNKNNTMCGITHENGNGICLKCWIAIKDAHIQVNDFPYEEAGVQ